jgi:hypothetical protein
VQDLPRDETRVGAKRDQAGTAINAQITSPVDLPDVRGLTVEMNPRGDDTIVVESTRKGTQCRKCGREIREFHGVEEGITLRHLPLLGRRGYLRIRPKRSRCP